MEGRTRSPFHATPPRLGVDEEPGWLKRTMPRVHRFLTRTDKPYPAVREFGVGALVVVVVLAALWGTTGQPLGRSPIVVVESGSMMHCENGFVPKGRDCDPTHYARLGTVDPGDLILVKDVDGRRDVETYAGSGENHYRRTGDVIVFRPDGNAAHTPIIHRALFWLEIHGDGTFSVPELGLDHVEHLNQPEVLHLGLRGNYQDELAGAGPGHSGFVTRGDNNAQADQGSPIARYPVQPAWILGKARAEVPWLGLVKLYFTDFAKPCPKMPLSGQPSEEGCNYHNSGTDSKTMLLLTLVVLLGGPYAFEKSRARQRGGKQRDEGELVAPVIDQPRQP